MRLNPPCPFLLQASPILGRCHTAEIAENAVEAPDSLKPRLKADLRYTLRAVGKQSASVLELEKI